MSAAADCAGSFSLWSPAQREVFASYQDVGASQVVGRYKCGTELVFAITAGAQCGGVHAIIVHLTRPTGSDRAARESPKQYPGVDFR